MAEKVYKFIDHEKFKSLVKTRFGNIDKFAKASGIPDNAVSKYFNDDNISIFRKNADKICLTLKVKLEDTFIEEDVKYRTRQVISDNQQDKSNIIVSEEIIVGLKKNICDRLLLLHSKCYVNEISAILDELIIEASYLGVNCKEVNKEKFIVSAITKRRSK
jgi:hypothetical protein